MPVMGAWLPFLSTVAMAWGSIPAIAQMVISARSGVVNCAEGLVFLDDQAVESSITKHPEIKENAVLRTAAGQVEILLTPGVILRIGENTALKMITRRLVDTRVEIQTGSAVLEAVHTGRDNNVTVVLNNASVAVTKAGIYRFNTKPAQIKVFHGEVTVEISDRTATVATGRMLLLDGPRVSVEKFNMQQTDALDRWSRQRSQIVGSVPDTFCCEPFGVDRLRIGRAETEARYQEFQSCPSEFMTTGASSADITWDP
jgi:hypothetical protein